MSTEIKHYVNEAGSTIVVDTGLDLSEATSTKINIKKPDGTIVSKNSSVYTIDSVANYLKYTSISGDLDQVGKYLVQPYVVLPNWSGYGETSYFIIYNLFN